MRHDLTQSECPLLVNEGSIGTSVDAVPQTPGFT